MCPSSPFAFAKTKLVDADFDIFSLKSLVQVEPYLSSSEPGGTVASYRPYSSTRVVRMVEPKTKMNPGTLGQFTCVNLSSYPESGLFP